MYLAVAPKSNRTYRAWKSAAGAARESPSAPVPLEIRNAPTELMESLGYGQGYRYDPDEPDGVSGLRFLPESLGEPRFYEPGPYGFEKTVQERLDWFRRKRRDARLRSGASGSAPPSDRGAAPGRGGPGAEDPGGSGAGPEA